MTDETQSRRAQFVRYGIPVLAAVLVVLFGIEIAQSGVAVGRGTLFFFAGACVILIGSIVFSVRDARAARAAQPAEPTEVAIGADDGDESP